MCIYFISVSISTCPKFLYIYQNLYKETLLIFVTTMKRKIIKLGQATYVLSLPSSWIRKFELDKGDYLDVQEKGNMIVASTQEQKERRKAVVNMPPKKDFLQRLVCNPYRIGYDEIRFNFNDPNVFPAIQECSKKLMGFEIVEQAKNYCIMRNVASNLENEMDNIFKRIFFILASLLDELVMASKQSDFTQLAKIKHMEAAVDRLKLFCERIINTKSNTDYHDSFSLITLEALEQIGDLIRNISIEMLNLKKASSIVQASLIGAKDLYDRFFRSYYKSNLSDLVKFKHGCDKITIELKKDIKSVHKSEILIIGYILWMIDLMRQVAPGLHLIEENEG